MILSVGCERLSVIDTGVGRVRFFRCHTPERVFDDDRRVVSDAQFKEQDLSDTLVSFLKAVLFTQIHIHSHVQGFR